MHSLRSLATQDRLEQAALSAGADRVVGLPVIMRHESIAIIMQLGRGLLAACILATLVIAIAFRWPSLLAVLLAPNIIPLAVTAAALHVLDGGHLTPTAVLALTIAFGIAVNDSIHFASRYRLELNNGLDQRSALMTSLTRTGRVMVLTTVLLCVGMLVTQFSVFAPVRLFGQMMIMSFFLALAADLVLLPALLKQVRS
jgi:predicted RND superfamily exporter protein